MQLSLVVPGTVVASAFATFITTGPDESLGLGIKHGVQGLLDRVANHSAEMIMDDPVIDLDDLSHCLRRISFFCDILFHGGSSCPVAVVSSTSLGQIGVTNLILEFAKDSGFRLAW